MMLTRLKEDLRWCSLWFIRRGSNITGWTWRSAQVGAVIWPKRMSGWPIQVGTLQKMELMTKWMFWVQYLTTYIDMLVISVLVDVHVWDLVAGVWSKRAVSRLARGEDTGVIVRTAWQGGAAGASWQQSWPVLTSHGSPRGQTGAWWWGARHTPIQVLPHPGLKQGWRLNHRLWMISQ